MRKLLNISYHRNGVACTGFYVARFVDNDRRVKVCTWFGAVESESDSGRDNTACAVLDVELLASGVIASDDNAYRGDDYVDDMERWVKAWIAAYHTETGEMLVDVYNKWQAPNFKAGI